MTEPLWRWQEIVAASGGMADGQPPAAVTGLSIDSRTLEAGDLFVALKDQRDGHEFVGAAFAKGAAAALVTDGYARQVGDDALIRCDDPLSALGRIAAAARARLSPEARVIAVTGSAGKTGTKEMLRQTLAVAGPTHAPEKSYNNHWGVPLTLARMPRTSRYAVIEIGMNHAGEITPLTKLARPHVAIITNVLPVHVGNFSDGETGVANAKAEILLGLLPGGIAVLNRDNRHFARLAARAAELGATVVSFGRDQASDVRLVALEPEAEGSAITVSRATGPVAYRLGAPGEHLALNSLAVVAALDVVGVDAGHALPVLAGFRAAEGRGARSTLKWGQGEVLLINESYNANPASMRAALLAMASVPRAAFPRRVAVLGDMLELGAGAAAYHRGLKEAIDAAEVDLVLGCGPNMRLLCDALEPTTRSVWAADSNALEGTMLAVVQAGDVVMVKGSLGSRMAPLVAALKQKAGAA